MLRRLYYSILILSLTITLNGQKQLSENSKISVLTCSQGEELYSAFGHSAIRILDAKNNIDWVFNYGTFNFNTPNFYLKFANGKLNYMISIGEFKRFLPEYFKDNRSVTEQILNLSLKDRQRIFDALLINYKPENRNYKYDFFYDNCATRIHDIVANNIGGKLILESTGVDSKEISFRTYLHHYLTKSPWIETGLNLILGLPADKMATIKESTYLPDFLMRAFARAKVVNADGSNESLIKETVNLLSFEPEDDNKFSISPIIFFWSLLAIIIGLSLLLKTNYLIWFDRILFFIAGLVGLLISYLWLITDHSVTGNNLNILWALPSFIYLAFTSYKGKISNFILKLNSICVLLFIISWYFLPQTFPLATIPIALLLMYRILSILRSNKSLQL